MAWRRQVFMAWREDICCGDQEKEMELVVLESWQRMSHVRW